MADAKQKLVIVESPAKARTISRYLGAGYDVESSIGHIRDLPEKASQIPAAEREKYGALGVAVEDDFEPYYVVDPDKKKVVTALKKKLAQADELLLATDEDREGEAIAWHLVQELRPKVPVRRMVFHEITKDAIVRALDETREVDVRLVDSQETRRILDRLYGYEVSPVLWKKVMRGLSAGRVQSVATRLVVDRELERIRFVIASYWDVVGTFEPGPFEARLVSVDGKRVAQGQGLRQHRDDGRFGARAGRGAGDRTRAGSRRPALRGHIRRGEAVPAQPGRAVPHLHAPTGGEPEVAVLVADHDAGRPAALRERLHHIHADGFRFTVGHGRTCRTGTCGADVRRRHRSRLPPPVRAGGRERAGGARGDSPCG